MASVGWAIREGQTGEVFSLGRGNFVQGDKISAGVWENRRVVVPDVHEDRIFRACRA
jgi:hypothetical protein